MINKQHVGNYFFNTWSMYHCLSQHRSHGPIFEYTLIWAKQLFSCHFIEPLDCSKPYVQNFGLAVYLLLWSWLCCWILLAIYLVIMWSTYKCTTCGQNDRSTRRHHEKLRRKNSSKQESPPAWTQEAYRPPRGHSNFLLFQRGGGWVPWQKFFFPVWTCIKPNLVSKFFPCTETGYPPPENLRPGTPLPLKIWDLEPPLPKIWDLGPPPENLRPGTPPRKSETWDPSPWTDTHLWKHNLPSYVRTRAVTILFWKWMNFQKMWYNQLNLGQVVLHFSECTASKQVKMFFHNY